jgi:hypothetical protein
MERDLEYESEQALDRSAVPHLEVSERHQTNLLLKLLVTGFHKGKQRYRGAGLASLAVRPEITDHRCKFLRASLLEFKR